MGLLWSWWLAIWPNLAANVLWIPVVYAWNHRHVKKLLENHHREIIKVMREKEEG
jgi:RNAse (barnase) inhibitor barstar